MMEYLDLFGTPIKIGDTVAVNPPYYKGLTKGKVVAFTPKSVRVKYKNNVYSSKDTFVTHPRAVVVRNDVS